MTAPALHRDTLPALKLPRRKSLQVKVDTFRLSLHTGLAAFWRALPDMVRIENGRDVIPTGELAMPFLPPVKRYIFNGTSETLTPIPLIAKKSVERQHIIMGTLRCAPCNGFCSFTIYAPPNMLDWVTFKASVYGTVRKTGAYFIEVQMSRADLTQNRQQLREALAQPNAVEIHMARGIAA